MFFSKEVNRLIVKECQTFTIEKTDVLQTCSKCIFLHMFQLSRFEREAPVSSPFWEFSSRFFLKSPVLRWSWLKCQIVINLLSQSHFLMTLSNICVALYRYLIHHGTIKLWKTEVLRRCTKDSEGTQNSYKIYKILQQDRTAVYIFQVASTLL